MTPRATELRRRLAKRRKAWLPPDLEGEVFGDRYRLGELIGIGGMALVYKAEHIEIHKPVAVKILHPRYADRPEYARRFLAEARAASKLSHDHIIDISDFGRASDGYVYYVLEYLEGEDLEQTLKEDGPLPWFRVVPIAKQICKALTAAHEAGIIHRDIKPGNCFRITRDENNDFIKILDFGIATSALKSQAGDRDEPLGTPAYMAPELFLGVPFDHRVDLYSLGVCAYEML
ncbi:MAG: serine/threonine protein kinase, partial [Myxococcales bacterium]|nr:serine/threonine protein kinase [Myxococcales bacterium]